MRSALPLFLLLLSPCLSPEFIAGQQSPGGRVFVLCEGHPEVLVVTPEGGSFNLPLDSDSQAWFIPQINGPYSVQCGKEAKAVQASVPSEIEPWQSQDGNMQLFLIAASVALAALAIITVAVLFSMLSGQRTLFVKRIEGKRATIVLRPGQALIGAVVFDPIQMGSKESLRLKIGSLSKGQLYEHEYEISEPARALPAELSAQSRSGKLRLLSQVHCDSPADGLGKEPGKAGKSKVRRS